MAASTQIIEEESEWEIDDSLVVPEINKEVQSGEEYKKNIYM